MSWVEPFILLVCGILSVSASSDTSYQYFGTKTSYFVNANTDTSPVEIEGCQPALFWILARHGTRNPGDDDIPEMNDQLPGIRDQIVTAWSEGLGELEEEEILRFMEWEFSLTIEEESLLTESGKQEHMEMGDRWAKRLPDLLQDSTRTLVRSSTKSRCIESSKAFTYGAFGNSFPDIQEDNHLLRFYSDCPKFQTEVDDNEETYAERDKFIASQVFQEMVERVNSKAGIPLTVSRIILIWDMCRYENAWYPDTTSPWCSLFSEADLELFEFQEDLRYYYNDAYAYNITAQMTQPLFQDLFSKIDQIQSGVKASTSILNFAHSETVQPFMTALGLYRDQGDLMASDWGTEKQEHEWQVARIASFATNVGVAVFECNSSQEKRDSQSSEDKDKSSEEESSSEEEISSEEDESSEEYKSNSSSEEDSVPSSPAEWKVMLFHQERSVPVPACGEYICSLAEFSEAYRYLADQDFDTVCQI